MYKADDNLTRRETKPLGQNGVVFGGVKQERFVFERKSDLAIRS